jgi:hypothetical protein
MPPFSLLGVLLAQSAGVMAPAAEAPATAPTATVTAPATTTTTAVDAPVSAPATPPADGPSSPVLVPPPEPRAWRPRPFGLHLGINATLMFDATIGRYVYAGFATQLTGAAFFADQNRNVIVSALAFGGVAIPLIEREDLRFTADFAPMVSYFHAAPVNMLNIGVLAGVRVQHRSGFTFGVKLPLVGYAGAPDAQRGSLMYFYYGAIVTVPAITFGYSF